MKKLQITFTVEEAETMAIVFSSYQMGYNTLLLKSPGVDIDFHEMKFIDESIGLINDAIAIRIDVLLELHPSIWWVLYELAKITATYSTEANEHVCYCCITKLLLAGKRGASSCVQ